MVAAGAGTPVSRDPRVVRARILDAAEAEFMAHGYEAASTNRITERFGGSKATVFRHYTDKKALLAAVLERTAGSWREAVDCRALPVDDPQAWLEGFGVQTLGWILGPGPLFIGRLGIAEGRQLLELEQLFDDMAGAPLRRLLSRRLAAWTRDGRLQCRQPARDAAAWFDLVVAGEVARALYGLPAPTARQRQRHVAHAVALFLNGCADRAQVGELRPAPQGTGGSSRWRRSGPS